LKYIVFESGFEEIVIQRKVEKDSLKFNNCQEFEKAYMNGYIHPSNLKSALAQYINLLLRPVTEHFENDPYAVQLFEQVKKYR
jgi:tyrosyl-tRNA synthetase